MINNSIGNSGQQSANKNSKSMPFNWQRESAKHFLLSDIENIFNIF